MSSVPPETLARLREVLRECGYNATDKTAQNILDCLPAMLLVEQVGFGELLVIYADGEVQRMKPTFNMKPGEGLAA